MEEHRGWRLANRLSGSPFEPQKERMAESGEPPREERDSSEAPVSLDEIPALVESSGYQLSPLIEARHAIQPLQESSVAKAQASTWPMRASPETAEATSGRVPLLETGDRPDRTVASPQQGEVPAPVNAGLADDLKADMPPVTQNARPLRFSAKGNEGAAEQGTYGAGPAVDQKQTPVRVVAVQTAPAPAAVLPGMSDTAAALTSSLVEDSQFASKAAAAAHAATESRPRGAEPVNTLRLQLQPAHLGMVTARLSLSENQLMVELEVETPEARRTLQSDGEAMREALRAVGYDVDRITVIQAPSSASSNSASSTSGRDPSFHAGAGQGQSGGDSQPQTRQGNGHGGATIREAVDRRQNDAADSGLYI